jgi:cyclophilin family peptidyl-prolyl cis-trans isomerase
MAELQPPRQVPETDPTAIVGASKNVRLAVAGVLVLAVAGTAWWIFGHVKEGRSVDRWQRLDDVESARVDLSARTWLEVPMSADAARAKREHVEKLEALLAEDGDDPAFAAHVRALLANLELTLALGLGDAADPAEVAAHRAKAKEHLTVLADKYPDVPINRDRFKPVFAQDPANRDRAPSDAQAPSVARLLLRKIDEDTTWLAAHGRKPVEPDADPIVLLRTDRGDLRLRVYSTVAPNLVKGFLDHVSKGDYDDTLLFEKRDEPDEGWLRGGDPRAKLADPSKATDEQRKTWGQPTPADPLAPEDSRNLVSHKKGIVSAWHPPGDDLGEDPSQFLLVTKDSTRLDAEFAPFARVEPVSIPTLEQMFSAPLHGTKGDSLEGKLREQLERPIRIVKAFVYDKGAIRATDAPRASESEKRLDAVKVDEYKREPPAPPAVPPTGAPPAPADGSKPPTPPAPPATPPGGQKPSGAATK